MSRISKSMERLRFYRDLSTDLRSEPDKSIYFWSLGVIYFIMQSWLEKGSKNYLVYLLSEEIAVRHLVYVVNSCSSY